MCPLGKRPRANQLAKVHEFIMTNLGHAVKISTPMNIQRTAVNGPLSRLGYDIGPERTALYLVGLEY